MTAPPTGAELVETVALRPGYRISRIVRGGWQLAGDHRHLAAIAASGVDVISAQVQYSLLDRRPEGDCLEWAEANDVAVLAYGALAGGS